MTPDKHYFENYKSNTIAGTSNQTFFYSDGELRKGRVYYKIFAGGKYKYSLMFSGVVDSTFSDGDYSVCNTICKKWKIHSLKVGKTEICEVGRAAEPESFTDVYFDGKQETEVDGNFVCCDEFEFEAKSGEFMCVEIEYSGEMIPCHEQIIIDSYDFSEGKWISSPKTPVPNFVGCCRPVKHRIVYLGDSITQGIGTEINEYNHWTSVLSEMLGNENAYWNIGIGFARSGDAASDGVWLHKAKQGDIVFVCLGVNDVFKVDTAQEVCVNLEKIIDILHENGVKVILQSVPPFNYTVELTQKWNFINEYIEKALKNKVELYFDCVPVLSVSQDKKECAKYGGHPNSEGCAQWALALYEKVKDFIGE